MKIQELMMKTLCLPTWEEVEQACPITSEYKALEEFFIVFREYVYFQFEKIQLSFIRYIPYKQ